MKKCLRKVFNSFPPMSDLSRHITTFKAVCLPRQHTESLLRTAGFSDSLHKTSALVTINSSFLRPPEYALAFELRVLFPGISLLFSNNSSPILCEMLLPHCSH